MHSQLSSDDEQQSRRSSRSWSRSRSRRWPSVSVFVVAVAVAVAAVGYSFGQTGARDEVLPLPGAEVEAAEVGRGSRLCCCLVIGHGIAGTSP